jgi:hypothetical protein
MMRSWLNEGRVSPETLVWCEGWPDWQEAGSVFPELQSAPASSTAPPVATTTKVDGATSTFRTGPRRRKSGPNVGLIVVLVSVVVLLLVILIWILSGGLGGDSEEPGNDVASRTVVVSHSEAGQPA